MGVYRNHPGGMNGISEDTRGKMTPVALEDIAESGNRVQRRWAQKKLTKINRNIVRQQAAGGGNG